MNAPTTAPTTPGKTFPIQRGQGNDDGPTSVAWADAEHAYRGYSRLYGTQQSLERLAERGGFGWIEYRALRAVADYLAANPNASSRELHDEMDAAFDSINAERAIAKLTEPRAR